MSQLQGASRSLPVKLALLAATTQAVILVVLVGISEVTRDASTVTRAALFALPLLVPILIVYFLTRFIATRITTVITAAYGQLGSGDFGVRLPPRTAGADFVTVHEAFSDMAAALERSMQALRDADLERRRLFADLAHELATPTTTLLGIAHALRTDPGDTSHMLDHLEHESARLERLIADVREVAHLEDPALPMLLEPCDVGDLASRAVDRARLAGGGACELRCDAKPAPARIDPQRIDQVLANLINNAVRHAEGGTVVVTARPDGDSVRIRIEDSGAGVPDELLPELGRRLLRIDPSRSRDTGGHGLGLSIVRAIVARHGGEITFGRAAIGGLCAEVRLPATRAPSISSGS